MIGRALAFTGHTVFRRLLGAVALLALYSLVDDYFWGWLHEHVPVPNEVRTLLGAALSVLLVLRTNTAYDRWWEGRKLWGQLINDCRNLALKVQTMVAAPELEKARLAVAIGAFPRRLCEHLRAATPAVPHAPAEAAGKIFQRLQGWREAGFLDGHTHQMLDRHASALMDICGACERIRNTPLPLSHRALIPQLLICYLVLLPVDMPSTWGSMVVVCALGYFLLGLELIAEELEQPFGLDSDDLPMEQFCQTIRRSADEALVRDPQEKEDGPQGGGPGGRE